MAVTDFGSRRFADSAPRQARQYQYQHQAQDDYDEEYGWYDEDQHYAEEYPDGLGVRLGRLTHYLGAVVSVILLVGLVVWGYKLVARDVSGVPVIRAVQGEARTAPDEPGGELVRNGGLSVNEVAAGVEVPPSAEIAIAPASTGLEADDIAMGELADISAMDAIADETLPVSPEDPVVAISDADAAAGLTTDLAALDIVSADNPSAANMMAVEDITPIPTVQAARPAPRPASVAQRAAAAPATSAERPAVEEAVAEAVAETEAEEPPVQQASVSSGAPLVQIGAFDSNDIANGEWGRISGRFSSLFAGKSPVVQTTDRNGRTFYRLRVAGFESRDDARRFCAALIAEGTDCYPATAQ
ncbi:SPOR domain-containing protein [Paracoccus albus]|uniref:SPOR domain-containing protein n=1 Tax=Paracoccus albus TaxID=3017784 RepID=UPI0022F0F2D9|nr:SPOR domain-containing protein [Paracoccus albus]WBU61782.1 SPOR domain-containing protein [Paracoccus albus]